MIANFGIFGVRCLLFKKRYLEEKGVNFDLGTEVIDIDLSADKKTATILHLKNKTEIILNENNFVFFTNCVFTVEYSVRTAQMAVYGLFDTNKKVHPMYESTHNPKYLFAALKAINR